MLARGFGRYAPEATAEMGEDAGQGAGLRRGSVIFQKKKRGPGRSPFFRFLQI